MPSNVSALMVGESKKLTAMAVYSDGTAQDVSNAVTWSSSNIAIASVSNSGLLTAIGVGTASVSASGKTGFIGVAEVSVTLPTAPEARLDVAAMALRADGAFTFAGIVPMEFDARRSSGSGLSYRIDFGDGGESASVQTSHHYAYRYPYPIATLTVTDRFGRSARATSPPIVAIPLGTYAEEWIAYEDTTRVKARSFDRLAGSITAGRTFTGRFRDLIDRIDEPFSGTISSSGGVNLRLSSGVLFSGPLYIGATQGVPSGMTLAQTGGPDDGRTFKFEIAQY